MSKKTFVLVVCVMVLLFAGLLWLFIARENKPAIVDNKEDQSSDLFPFGKRSNSAQNDPVLGDKGDTSSTTIDLGGSIPEEAPRLRQIAKTPIAGAAAFNQGSTTIIRFVDRATGHIYSTENSSTATDKISAITIPKVYEALWSNDGTRLLLRYLRDDNQTIRTFYAKIASSTKPEQALEGIFLPDGLRDVAVYGGKMFYIDAVSSGSQGNIANIDGSGKTTIFSSPFEDWSYVWTSPSSITLYSRPSFQAQGAAYMLNVQNGAYTKALSGQRGLVALGNTDSTSVIYSSIQGNSIVTSVIDTKTGASQNLGIATIADKCVWSSKEKKKAYCAVPTSIPSGEYPDDWYKGKISFNDSLWSVNVVTGETKNIFSPELEAGISIDMINLKLDPEEQVLVFTNKKDLSLWSYRLK